MTTTDDTDHLIPAVRLLRPEKRSIASLKGYEESAWEPVKEATWRPVWDCEIAEADPRITRELVRSRACCCRSGRAFRTRGPRIVG